MQRIRTALIIAAVLGAACGDEPGAPTGDDLEMVYWSGDAQSRPCYEELANPLVVWLMDRGARPVVGQDVRFRVLEGEGWVREATVVSDSAGFAATYWTVGTLGAQVLEARATSPDGTGPFARFTATAEPADAGERLITVTDLPNAPLKPAVSGDRIVYTKVRNRRYDVYLYDLVTETETRITTDASRFPWDPDIAGDLIVWAELRDAGRAIYLHDLATDAERRITVDGAVAERPAISGTRIVWQDARDLAASDVDVYMHDLASGTERRITTDSADQISPAISGEHIVWLDRRHGGLDVYLYDLGTGTERRLATGSSVSISGDRVVYHRYEAKGTDVYLYDLTTDSERRITTDASDPWAPAISGDRIVWVDWRSGKPELYLYNLATATERRLPTGTSPSIYPSTPAISGDYVAWGDDRNRSPSGYVTELYLYDLASACVPPDPAPGPERAPRR